MANVPIHMDQGATNFQLDDNATLTFGTGSDVTLTWNGSELIITGLPTSDPSVAGALYTSTNVVTVSAG